MMDCIVCALVGEQPSCEMDGAVGGALVTVRDCASVAQEVSLQAMRVMAFVPAAEYLVVKLGLPPADGEAPGADHDRVVIVPEVEGEQVTA
jgi:hypothetical protein